jgi:hypothetical protein
MQVGAQAVMRGQVDATPGIVQQPVDHGTALLRFRCREGDPECVRPVAKSFNGSTVQTRPPDGVVAQDLLQVCIRLGVDQSNRQLGADPVVMVEVH